MSDTERDPHTDDTVTPDSAGAPATPDGEATRPEFTWAPLSGITPLDTDEAAPGAEGGPAGEVRPDSTSSPFSVPSPEEFRRREAEAARLAAEPAGTDETAGTDEDPDPRALPEDEHAGMWDAPADSEILTGEEVSLTVNATDTAILGRPDRTVETAVVEPVILGSDSHPGEHVPADAGWEEVPLEAVSGPTFDDPADTSAGVPPSADVTAGTPSAEDGAGDSDADTTGGADRSGTEDATPASAPEIPADDATDLLEVATADLDETPGVAEAAGGPADTDAPVADGAGETPAQAPAEEERAAGPDVTPAAAGAATAGSATVEAAAGAAEAFVAPLTADAPPLTPKAVPVPHAHDVPRDVLENRHPIDEDDDPSTTMVRRTLMTPATPPEGQPETPWRPRVDAAADVEPDTTPRTLDDALFEGSTVVPVVPNRGGAHAWSLILTLLLTPVAWYLAADSAARATLGESSALATGVPNWLGVGEFAGAVLAVVLIIWLATRSSLGAWVTGLVVTVASLGFVLTPGPVGRALLPALQTLNGWNAFGANLAHHLQSTGYSGALTLAGLALWGLGIVAHHVRRRGRAEEAVRAQVERVNPAGAHLTWRERRRARRAQEGR